MWQTELNQANQSTNLQNQKQKCNPKFIRDTEARAPLGRIKKGEARFCKAMHETPSWRPLVDTKPPPTFAKTGVARPKLTKGRHLGRGEAFQANPSKSQSGPKWTKPGNNEIFLSPAQSRRATNSKIICRTRVLSIFGPPKKRSKVNICAKWLAFCSFWSKWPPDCRTEGFKNGKHNENWGWELSPSKLKSGLKARERSIFHKA